MVKIVEVNSEVYPLDKLENICTHIERCGRTCYKSENLITQETAVPFSRFRGATQSRTNWKMPS